jgi:hypothetical protein
VCNAENSWTSLSAASKDAEIIFAQQSKAGRYTERINTGDLIQYSPEDKKGNVVRTGSKTLKRECGIFKISIQGGFINEDPQGELGGDDFPFVEISVNQKSETAKIFIGECNANIRRYSYFSECPSNWATYIEASIWGKAPRILLKHSYDEFRPIH